jgi:hypothetical protein
LVKPSASGSEARGKIPTGPKEVEVDGKDSSPEIEEEVSEEEVSEDVEEVTSEEEGGFKEVGCPPGGKGISGEIVELEGGTEAGEEGEGEEEAID